MATYNEAMETLEPHEYVKKHGQIDIDVSDLFFNHDLSDAILMDGDKAVGWDMAKLRAEAELFNASVERLAPGKAPGVTALLADYFARM